MLRVAEDFEVNVQEPNFHRDVFNSNPMRQNPQTSHLEEYIHELNGSYN